MRYSIRTQLLHHGRDTRCTPVVTKSEACCTPLNCPDLVDISFHTVVPYSRSILELWLHQRLVTLITDVAWTSWKSSSWQSPRSARLSLLWRRRGHSMTVCRWGALPGTLLMGHLVVKFIISLPALFSLCMLWLHIWMDIWTPFTSLVSIFGDCQDQLAVFWCQSFPPRILRYNLYKRQSSANIRTVDLL